MDYFYVVFSNHNLSNKQKYVCSRLTGANREGIRVRIFPAVLRTRPGLGQKIITVCPGNATVCDVHFDVAPDALRCVPVRPDTPQFCPGNRLQSPGVTTARHGSRTAEPRCFTVAYEYQWNFRETHNRNILCKVQNSTYILRQKKNIYVSGREDTCINCISNETLPPYPHLSLIIKLFGLI